MIALGWPISSGLPLGSNTMETFIVFIRHLNRERRIWSGRNGWPRKTADTEGKLTSSADGRSKDSIKFGQPMSFLQRGNKKVAWQTVNHTSDQISGEIRGNLKKGGVEPE